MKIRIKVLLIIFSLILVTGAVAIIVSRTVSKNIVGKQIRSHLETTAQSRARHIETVLTEYKGATEMLAAGNSFKNVVDSSKNYSQSIKQLNRRIKNAIQSHKDISIVSVLNKNGTVIGSSHTDIGLDLRAAELFLKGKEKVYIGDIHTCRYTGNPVLNVAAPILVNGEFSGVVIVNFDAEEQLFEITTDRTGLGETGEVYVVNKDKYMITPSRFVNDTFLKRKVDTGHGRTELEAVKHLDAHEPEHVVVLCKNYLDTGVLRVHTHIPEMDWCLLAEISQEEAFAPLTKLDHVMLSILAALSLVGLTLSILISSKITSPILKLQRGAQEIQKGNLDHKIGIKRSDEIGQLSKAFDKMAASLKISRQELEEYSKGLEERVEQRTKELNDKVKESEELRLATLNLLQNVNETKNDLKKAKEEIEKTNRNLTASNKELQDFVYIASHDLREPIRKISAFGQLLQDSLKGKLDEDQQENFTFMIDGAMRMHDMIDDLLTYSRVSTKVKPAERVDLNEVVEGLKNVELAAVLEETRGTICVPKPLLAIQVDASQVYQLLQNLIGNGLRYQRDGTPPEITVRSRQEGDNMVRVEVEDSGIGIAEENYDRIFLMFRRLHSREEYEGSGIGLAVCKKIVDRHGGNIGVSSTVREGSTFWFTLPAGN